MHSYSSIGAFYNGIDAEVKGCILLDSRMPGFSINEFKEKLKDLGQNLVIIFVTADDDIETRKKANRTGQEKSGGLCGRQAFPEGRPVSIFSS